MKTTTTLKATLTAFGLLAALPLAANAQSMNASTGQPHDVLRDSFSAACNDQNLNVGVQMAEDPFFRQFHNQDLVQSINQLRKSAQNDMASGRTEACGIKAATVSAMVKDPAHARVTLADFQSRQAAVTGGAVVSTESVAPGHHFTQAELMGIPLKSLNNETLGTITGVVYSQTGQPLYVTLTPTTNAPQTSSMMVPVGLLLVGNNPGSMYISLNSRDFWNEPRFHDLRAISPAS